MLHHAVRQLTRRPALPLVRRPLPARPASIAPLPLVLAAALMLDPCSEPEPPPAHDRQIVQPAGDGLGLASDGECPVKCSQLTCGKYACGAPCTPGSGCIDCAGKPCGSGFCHYGSGCFCGGQPCISSGCPPGTGCIP